MACSHTVGSEEIYEAMEQNGRPQIPSAEKPDQAENESGHSGHENPAGTLVKVKGAEDRRLQEY